MSATQTTAQEVKAFICGPPRDHECDDIGPYVAIYPDGREVPVYDPEKDFPKGTVGGSVTCSICGRSSMQTSMWL